jgi:tRNA modification GTPase
MPAADTIVAVATAPGRGAVGIVRVSGADVPSLAWIVLGRVPAPRVATRASFLAEDGTAIDSGLALYFPAPASFTGEHVLELQGHGGAVVLNLLVERLLQLGCRRARAGEFSERAFLNGKLDMAQAEAVADLIDAGTAAAARAAVRSLQGEFSRRIAALQAALSELRVHVEAAIDFPDEEIDFLDDPGTSARLATILGGYEELLGAAKQGVLLREGMTLAIAGKPNAGKSSLLNTIVGEDVAIVSEQAGTTRDVLRRTIELDGLPLHLVDTAGLREVSDAIELEGIRRAHREIRSADRILYLADVSVAGEDSLPGLRAQLDALPSGVAVTVIFNKIDLVGLPAQVLTDKAPAQIYLSARSGAGLDLLRAHLKDCAGYEGAETGALSARSRHLDALRRALVSTQAAERALCRTGAVELFAEELRAAQRALGEITGELSSEDLLGQIFASFCIGK